MDVKTFKLADQLKTVGDKHRIQILRARNWTCQTQIRTFLAQEPVRVYPFPDLGEIHNLKTFHEIKVNRFHQLKKPIKQKCCWCSGSYFVPSRIEGSWAATVFVQPNSCSPCAACYLSDGIFSQNACICKNYASGDCPYQLE